MFCSYLVLLGAAASGRGIDAAQGRRAHRVRRRLRGRVEGEAAHELRVDPPWCNLRGSMMRPQRRGRSVLREDQRLHVHAAAPCARGCFVSVEAVSWSGVRSDCLSGWQRDGESAETWVMSPTGVAAAPPNTFCRKFILSACDPRAPEERPARGAHRLRCAFPAVRRPGAE